MKKIAIVTVNFNGKNDTLDLLESLKKLSSVDCNLLTIIVDNGSTDGSVSEIQKKFPKVDILQTGENLGFTGGYNAGMKYAYAWGADFVFIINNDALTNDPNILEKLIKTADSDEKIGIVAPKIYFAKGFEFHKDRYQEENLGKVIWFAGGSFDWDNVQSVHRGIDEVDNGQFNDISEIKFATGCCYLIKREVLEKVGYFDNRYFAYFEDSDFSHRVIKDGFKIFYNGKTSIYHKVSQTAGVGSTSADYYGTRNRLIFGTSYASSRTKFALYRQALRFLLLGRPYQKKGVWDFLNGKTGPIEPSKVSEEKIDFPIKLSIVSVNYNTPDLINNLLKSIYNYPFSNGAMEVIILDNGSDQGCAEIVKKYPKAKFIQNKENTGFAKGYNKAIQFTLGKYVLMLNSDTEVLSGSLNKLVEFEDSKNGSVISAGKLYFPDLSEQDSVFRLPTILGALKTYLLGVKDAYFMYTPKVEKPIQVEGFVMACFMLPRRIINKLGLIDDSSFAYFEDIEYCRRAKQNNVSLFYIPDAGFIHHHGASFKKLKEGKAYEYLKEGSLNYHGKAYSFFLYWTLRIAQKISWVKTPVAR